MKISDIDSKTIDLLRFPLAVLVVFVHMHPQVVSPKDAPFAIFSGTGIANSLEIIFSFIISRVAVPCFFLISGYLFMNGLQNWNWHQYFRKIKKRIRSLVIPYFAWITLSVMCVGISLAIWDFKNGESFDDVLDFLKNLGFRPFWVYNIWGQRQVDWAGNQTLLSGPFIDTFWFLRDLIVVTLLSPLFYSFFKITRIWGIFILLFCFLSRFWFHFLGFDIDAFFFYGTGVFLSMNNKSVTVVARKLLLPLLIICIFSFVGSWYYAADRTRIGQIYFHFFVASGVLCYFNIACFIVKKWDISANPFLVSSCFFLYAFHKIPLAVGFFPISIIKELLSPLLHPLIGGRVLCYFITPVVTIIFSLLLYAIIRRLSPKICSLLSGNR